MCKFNLYIYIQVYFILFCILIDLFDQYLILKYQNQDLKMEKYTKDFHQIQCQTLLSFIACAYKNFSSISWIWLELELFKKWKQICEIKISTKLDRARFYLRYNFTRTRISSYPPLLHAWDSLLSACLDSGLSITTSLSAVVNSTLGLISRGSEWV